MRTADELALLIDHFVEDIQALVQRAAHEAVREVLACLGAPSAAPAPAAELPVQRPKPGKRPVARALPRPARASLPPAPSPTESAVASERIETPPQPAEPAPTERETLVLRAVDDLIRATAGEVAEHTALPNGTVSVTLRALVARGRLLRAETPRGVEYSVVASDRSAASSKPASSQRHASFAF